MESVPTVQAHFANLTNVVVKMNRTNGFAVEVSDILVGGSVLVIFKKVGLEIETVFGKRLGRALLDCDSRQQSPWSRLEEKCKYHYKVNTILTRK